MASLCLVVQLADRASIFAKGVFIVCIIGTQKRLHFCRHVLRERYTSELLFLEFVQMCARDLPVSECDILLPVILMTHLTVILQSTNKPFLITYYLLFPVAKRFAKVVLHGFSSKAIYINKLRF